MNYTDEQIKSAMIRYEKNRNYQRNYYRNKYQNDPEYREKVKLLSRNSYYKNSEKKKERYQIQKEYIQAQRRFRYWYNKNDIEKYKTKYPDDWERYKDEFTQKINQM